MNLFANYIRLGWSLVPISQGSKGPRHTGWNKPENLVTSHDDMDRITAGVGLAHAFSRTCAIDIDNLEAAKQWFSENGIDLDALMADAVMIISRPGKAKLIYKLPEGMEPLQTRMLRKHGVELRCGTTNGLTVQDVLPPSIHPNTGKPYRWKGDFRNLPTLPKCLIDLWRQYHAKGTYRVSPPAPHNSEMLIEVVLMKRRARK